MDLTGRVIGSLAWEKLDENTWKGELSMNAAEPGLYIARVKIDQGVEIVKFIKK